MATAAIIFQQDGDGYSTACSRDDLVLGLPVTILNEDDGGVVSWLWIMVDMPSGSTATIASPSSGTTTFTPDLEGTYLVKLVINSSITDQRGAGVKTANLAFRIPAATETTEFDGTRGWATAVNYALKLLDDGYFLPTANTLQTAYDADTGSVTLSSAGSGLQVHDANSPITDPLFEVDAYGNGTKYLTVTPAASTFVGQILQTGGTVGLGTATPFSGYPISSDALVHIQKTGHNILLVDTATPSSDSGIAFFTTTAAADSAIFLDESDSQKLKFALGNVDTDSTRLSNTKMTIQQDGAVGVGTTSPTAKLHVVGTGLFTGLLSVDAGFSAGADSSMDGYILGSVGTPVVGGDAANKDYVDGLVGTSGNLSGSMTATRIPYATAATTFSDTDDLSWEVADTILKASNVWIGNRIIGCEDDIEYLSLIGGQNGGVDNGGEVRLGGGDRTDSDISVIQFRQNGTEIARFQGDNTNGNAGSLGIGTDDPRYELDVYGTGHIDSILLIGNVPTNNPTTQLLVTNQSTTPYIGIQGHASAAPTIGMLFFDALATSPGDAKARILSNIVTGSVFIDYNSGGIGSFQVRNNIGSSIVLAIDAYGDASFANPLTVNGYEIDPGATVPVSGESLVYDGYAFVPTALYVPVISDNTNLPLTTTDPTVVVAYTPPIDGDYVVFVYYRVITATTTLAIDITWTDESGLQTYSILPASAEAVGSYSSAPLYITATTDTAISITATADTADQVYVSGTTMALQTTVNTPILPAIVEEADIVNYQLTTTSVTNVLAFTPLTAENFFVYIYYRVAVGTTNVTINLTFNDGGGAQTLNILPLSAKTIGSYSVSPVYVSAVTTNPIIVAVTAGTANQVYVSATITMV